jgi:hypothetical protein
MDLAYFGMPAKNQNGLSVHKYDYESQTCLSSQYKITFKRKKKGEDIPARGCGNPQDCETFRLLVF